MTEVWGAIPGWTHYEASTFGRIRTVKTGRIRKAFPSKKYGHLVVRLFDGERSKGFSVHRLVLTTFTPGGAPAGLCALHRYGDKTDNRVENLYWGTLRDNALDSVRHGTHPSARKTHCKRGHSLSGDNLALRANGTKRACRACDAARMRAVRASA